MYYVIFLFFQLKQRANYSSLWLLAKRFNRRLIKRGATRARVRIRNVRRFAPAQPIV